MTTRPNHARKSLRLRSAYGTHCVAPPRTRATRRGSSLSGHMARRVSTTARSSTCRINLGRATFSPSTTRGLSGLGGRMNRRSPGRFDQPARLRTRFEGASRTCINAWSGIGRPNRYTLQPQAVNLRARHSVSTPSVATARLSARASWMIALITSCPCRSELMSLTKERSILMTSNGKRLI
jgi:hypothetical protein